MSNNLKTHPLIFSGNRGTSSAKNGLWHKVANYNLQHETVASGSEVVSGRIYQVITSPHFELRVQLDDHGEKLYYALPPSSMPTSDLGGGVSALPAPSQRFIGVRQFNSEYIRILSYVQNPSDVGPNGVMLQEEPLDPGDMTLIGGGANSPKITMKGKGKLTLNVSTSVKQIFDKSSGKITQLAKQVTSNTLGGWLSVDYKKLDTTAPVWAPNSSLYTWVQRKVEDINTDTDEFESTESTNRVAPFPYVDKAVIRAGHIVGDLPTEDLGHMYELRTQQSRFGLPVTPVTGKSIITELKLGKQNNTAQYSRLNAGGSIISLRGKDILGPDNSILTPDPQTFSLRWGQYLSDDNILNKVKGENFTLRSLYGGTFATGPGEGWGYKEEDDAAEVFSITSGKVSGGALEPADYGDTFYRMRSKHYSPALAPVLGVDYKHYIGEGFDSDIDGISSTLMKRSLEEVSVSSKTAFNEVIATDDTWYRRQYKTGDPAWAMATEFLEELKSDGLTWSFKDASSTNDNWIKLGDDLAEISVKKGANTYSITMTGEKINIELKGATDTQSVLMDGATITVNCGNAPTSKVVLGGSGMEQQLVTKSWVDMLFATHMHPTAAPGPPSPPIPAPAVATPDNSVSPFTTQTIAE